MELSNPFEIVVYYLLIEGMICLDLQNWFPMMSALVCIVAHWREPIVNHDIGYWVIMTSLSYYVAWALNLERIFN